MRRYRARQKNADARAATAGASGVLLVGVLTLLVSGLALVTSAINASVVDLIVYLGEDRKDCLRWVEELRSAGLSAQVVVDAQPEKRKAELGIPDGMRACQTSMLVHGRTYVLEGEIPVKAILGLQADQPAIRGLIGGDPMYVIALDGRIIQAQFPKAWEKLDHGRIWATRRVGLLGLVGCAIGGALIFAAPARRAIFRRRGRTQSSRGLLQGQTRGAKVGEGR